MLLKGLLAYSLPRLVLTQFPFGIEFVCYSPSLFTVAYIYIYVYTLCAHERIFSLYWYVSLMIIYAH